MGAMIEGDELSPVSIEAKLRAKSRLIGTQGPIAMAVAMIEISAWDALSKASNLPLCRLLGAKPRAHPVYLTIPAMTPSRVRELAQTYFPQVDRRIWTQLGARVERAY
jgi:L-alanine-DL-glutamate epimerase-like enolase superfamily enzyme